MKKTLITVINGQVRSYLAKYLINMVYYDINLVRISSVSEKQTCLSNHIEHKNKNLSWGLDMIVNFQNQY